MTITDAGPLVALIDADEVDHEVCTRALGQLPRPLITTWPAFIEAMYLLSGAGGIRGQQPLWALLFSGRLEIVESSRPMLQRTEALMVKHADQPMDLADATLVALAEERGQRRIFTLDSDFRIYRLHGRHRFEVVPGSHPGQ